MEGCEWINGEDGQMTVFQHLPCLDAQRGIPAKSVDSLNLPPKKNSEIWNSKRMTNKATSKEDPQRNLQSYRIVRDANLPLSLHFSQGTFLRDHCPLSVFPWICCTKSSELAFMSEMPTCRCQPLNCGSLLRPLPD